MTTKNNVFVGNAFSLGMVNFDNFDVKVTTVDNFPKDATSVVGHADTAAVLGVDMNRVSLTLQEGDVLFVAQLQGGRLAEGTTTLPEGFSFKFQKVEVFKRD